MANARNKHLDKTYLSIDMAEERGLVHRDYIAHCFRWTHFLKAINYHGYNAARILEVGCGRELPLAYSLYANRFIPLEMVAVDAGPVNDDKFENITKSGKFPLTVYDNTIFPDDLEDVGVFDYITSFEVFEHVEPAMLFSMLNRMHRMLADTGLAFFSTPCWNERDCAANHVNEMKFATMGAILENRGFYIVDVFGTFASMADYLPQMTQPQLDIFHRLRSYYDTNVLSTIFAPLFPAHSRNALWVCRRWDPEDDPKFPPLHTISNPGSSTRWQSMLANNELEKLINEPVSEVCRG